MSSKKDEQHNPFIDGVWKTTNRLVIAFAIFNLYMLGIPALSFIGGNAVINIPKSNIVYKIDVNEKVRLDDRIIKFTKIIYDKNGDMNIFYEYYNAGIRRSAWSLGTIGDITDNLGNTYFEGSGSSSGGIKTKSVCTVKNFSSEADTLIISYDHYNRKYKVAILLEVGDKNK